jgi:hypothetical protein
VETTPKVLHRKEKTQTPGLLGVNEALFRSGEASRAELKDAADNETAR